MNYNFISNGYIGNYDEKMTLNSKFWALFDINSTSVENLLLPQRIPRLEFFDEILKNENKTYEIEFVKRIETIKNLHLSMINNISKNIVEIYNLERVLIRFGESEYVSNLPKIDVINSKIDNNFYAKISALRQSALLYFDISNNNSLIINNLETLLKTTPNLNIETKIDISIKIIVYSHRYKKQDPNIEIVKNLYTIINEFKPINLYQKFLYLMALRALPMSNYFSKIEKQTFIDELEIEIDKIESSTFVEKLLVEEIKLTSLLTIGKWYKINNQDDKYEQILNKLLVIDAFDSTITSEIGLYYLEKENFKLSEIYFKRSLELGPPALALNAFYYGVTLEKLGFVDEAILEYEKSYNFDHSSVSGLLELVRIYTKKNKPKLVNIIKLLFSNDILTSQLENCEIEELKLLKDSCL